MKSVVLLAQYFQVIFNDFYVIYFNYLLLFMILKFKKYFKHKNHLKIFLFEYNVHQKNDRNYISTLATSLKSYPPLVKTWLIISRIFVVLFDVLCMDTTDIHCDRNNSS